MNLFDNFKEAILSLKAQIHQNFEKMTYMIDAATKAFTWLCDCLYEVFLIPCHLIVVADRFFRGQTSDDPVPASVNFFLRHVIQIPVFRLALMDDLFSRSTIYFFNMCYQYSLFPVVFDPERAEASLQRFIDLGAVQQFVVPGNGMGQVHMMTMKASDLEEKIQKLGGTWSKVTLSSQKTVLAITPPQSNPEWNAFEAKLLKLGWEKQEGVIVTCTDADLIDPKDFNKYCFLHSHSTSNSFTSDWKRAGFYLGLHQDLCYFNNRNMWKSSGVPHPSEETFYEDIVAVYETIKKDYPTKYLWVGGSCGGAPAAGFLKAKLHDQGVNFFVEQSFPNLQYFVDPISPFWYPRILSCISSDQDPYRFSVDRMWKDLKKYDQKEGGKFILVEVEQDEHLSKESYNTYDRLAHRVNTAVSHIVFTATKSYRHADDFFLHSEPKRTFTKAVFH